MTKTILNHTLVKLFFVVTLAVGLVVGVVLPMAPMTYANGPGTTIGVSTTADLYLGDDGSGVKPGCSLRDAIVAANANTASGGCPAGTGGDIISLKDETYTLTRITGLDIAKGDLDITSSLTISGMGAGLTIIKAGAITDRVLHINGSVTVEITGVTIINGHTPNGADGTPAQLGEDGGGINIEGGGKVTLINSTVTSNTTGNGGNGTSLNTGGGVGGSGGGISIGATSEITIINSTVSNSTAGTGGQAHGTGSGGVGGAGGGINANGKMTLLNSTVSNNTAGDGGGGANTGNGGAGGGIYNTGPLTLTNSTISSNTTGSSGGNAGGDGGGIYNTGALTITNCTIVSNTTSSGGASDGDGGGICVGGGGDATVKNTILAHNSALAGSGPDCQGTIKSEGYNLIMTDTACTLTGNVTNTEYTIITDTNPLLYPLADNGGETQTHAPQTTSPVIDGGQCGGSGLATDQRDKYRLVPIPHIAHTHETTYSGDGCDIGSYEAQPELTMQKTVYPSNPDAGDMVTYTIVITNSGILSATGAVLSDPLTTSLTISPNVDVNPNQLFDEVPHVAVKNLTISPNLTITITIPVIISTSVVSGTTITNTATLTSAEISTATRPGGSSGSFSTIIVGPSDKNFYLPLIVKEENP